MLTLVTVPKPVHTYICKDNRLNALMLSICYQFKRFLHHNTYILFRLSTTFIQFKNTDIINTRFIELYTTYANTNTS